MSLKTWVLAKLWCFCQPRVSSASISLCQLPPAPRQVRLQHIWGLSFTILSQASLPVHFIQYLTGVVSCPSWGPCPTFSKPFWLYSFLKLHSIHYAFTVVSVFPPLLPSTQHPQLPQAIPSPFFMSIGHACKFFGYSISYVLYFTSLWSFCNDLFIVLIPLTFSPILPFPPSGNHQNAPYPNTILTLAFLCSQIRAPIVWCIKFKSMGK